MQSMTIQATTIIEKPIGYDAGRYLPELRIGDSSTNCIPFDWWEAEIVCEHCRNRRLPGTERRETIVDLMLAGF